MSEAVASPPLTVGGRDQGRGLSEVAQRITALGARIAETGGDAQRWRLAGTVLARRLDAMQRSLPGFTRGEAVWWTRPSADQPVTGRGSYADGFDNRAR